MQELREIIYASRNRVSKHEIACKRIDANPIARISWFGGWLASLLGHFYLKERLPATSWIPCVVGVSSYYAFYVAASKYDMYLVERRGYHSHRITLWSELVRTASNIDQQNPKEDAVKIVKVDYTILTSQEEAGKDVQGGSETNT